MSMGMCGEVGCWVVIDMGLKKSILKLYYFDMGKHTDRSNDTSAI